jgi:hypothetical protein
VLPSLASLPAGHFWIGEAAGPTVMAQLYRGVVTAQVISTKSSALLSEQSSWLVQYLLARFVYRNGLAPFLGRARSVMRSNGGAKPLVAAA